MNILENVNNLSITYKICLGLVFIFISILVYCIFNKNDLINTQKSKETFKVNNSPLFTMYYVDWCPHCVKAKPEFNKLKRSLPKINGKTISYKMINCEKEPEKAELENIKGYPTFILNIKGQKNVYQGDRTYTHFKSFLTNKCK